MFRRRAASFLYLSLRWSSTRAVKPWIHMNAAGASPQPPIVHDTMVRLLELERDIGAYAAAPEANENDARIALGRLLKCGRDEIALAESAQRAWALAFSSLDLAAKDHILCFEDEYAGNAVTFLQTARRTGCTLEVLPMRSDGIVDVDALSRALTSRSDPMQRTVVCLTHMQTSGSIVQPAARVGHIAKEHGALYILDACQTIGAMHVDVRALRCDFAAGTGRKWLRGPRGTGFLYARRGALAGEEPLVGEPTTIDHTSVQWTGRETYQLAADASRYELWESSLACRAGLAAAATLCAEEDPAAIFARATGLARRLRSGLTSIDGLVVRDAPPSFDEAVAESLGASRGAIVTFEVESTRALPAAEIHQQLVQRRIGASVSPPTHHFDEDVWARPPVVRLSPTYFNTEEEVDAVVAAVRDIVAERGVRNRGD